MTASFGDESATSALSGLALALALALPVGARTLSESAEAGEKLFAVKCLSCHTIGDGARSGPDLQGVTDLRDHDWLVRWLDDPMGMALNDPVGRELYARWNGLPMSDPMLDREGIEQVLAYLAEVGGSLPGRVELGRRPGPSRAARIRASAIPHHEDPCSLPTSGRAWSWMRAPRAIGFAPGLPATTWTEGATANHPAPMARDTRHPRTSDPTCRLDELPIPVAVD